MKLLAGRRIALGISASISVYKAPEIVRALQKQGAIVRVVMSEESTRFISPLIFEALTKAPILHASSESWSGGNDHISLASWAELFLIAPATANTINKLAQGIADNLLLSSFLAFKGKKLLAPAANTNMFQNPLTQESLQKLTTLGAEIIPPACKELACGIVGEGALQEPSEIVEWVVRAFYREAFWQGRSVAVSGGGSIEAIDEVRFLSNRSSGKMASALARALFYKGANVRFITSKTPEALPQAIEIVRVESGEEYRRALESWIKERDLAEAIPYLFMAAAIGDYRAAHPMRGKLKKEALGETWNLALTQSADVLASLPKEGIRAIGFKLEEATPLAKNRAQEAIAKKNLAAICLNLLGAQSPLESSENELYFLTPTSEVHLARASKLEVALGILREAERL